MSSKIEKAYVTDTNALLWYLAQDKKLSRPASAVYEAAERNQTIIIISVISIAELYYLNRKRLIFPNFAQTYASIKARPYFRLMSFNPDDVLEFDTNQAVPDM